MHNAFYACPALLLTLASAFAQPTSTGPLAPPANGPRRGDARWTALRDCTVHINPTATREHATVVFRDGVITSVLDGAEAPPGATVVECSGLHVYPGFIDAYVEVDAPPPAGDASTKHWSPKVTPQRSALDGAGVDERTAEGLRKIGFTAAGIAPRGGVFRGMGAVVSLAKPPDEQSAAKPPVYAERTYQSVAFELGGGYPGSEMGAIALIRQCLIDADWQQAVRAGGGVIAENCLDVLGGQPLCGGSESFANGPQVSATKAAAERRATQILFNSDDELEALRVIKIADEFKRPYMILGSGLEFERLGALKTALAASGKGLRETPAMILPLNFPKAPDVSSVGKAAGVELKELMVWEQAPTNPRRLAAAGVEFALTTAKLRDRNEFRRNVQSAIKHGLREEQALAALTTTPAQLLGIAGSCGTIEKGKRANLILADGPIFGEKTKLRSVYIDGAEHEMMPAPVEVDGRWEIAVEGMEGAEPGAEGVGHPMYLAIDKDGGLSVHAGEKSVKATRVSIDRDRMSFAFDHEALGGPKGVFVASAIIEREAGAAEGKPQTMSGTCLCADGSSFAWTATRTPPSAFVSSWRVVKADDVAKDPKAKEGLTIAITEGAVTLTFTKDKPRGKAEDVPGGDEPDADADHPEGEAQSAKPDTTPDAMPAKPDAKPGEVDPSAPERSDTATDADRDRMAGQRGEGEPESDGPRAGRARRPRAGGADIVIKCEDVVIEGDTLTFTHDLARIGGSGKSRDTVMLDRGGPGKDDDRLKGVGTLPDGSEHSYEAVRTPHEGLEIAGGLWLSVDEAERIKAIPEELPLPFGPYGLAEPAQAENVLLTGATVWTNGEAGIIPKGVVHVIDGKIAFVGDGPAWQQYLSRVRMKEMPREVDAAGKHITAGIIDCHSHTGISRGVNEGGQAVTAEVRIADVTDPDDVDWYRQLAGGVVAVNNLHGSANAIGGQSQTNKIRWGCAHPDDMHVEGAMPGIKFALGENPRQVNGGGGRGGSGRYPQTRMGVEQIIRDRFTAAKEYNKEQVRWEVTVHTANVPRGYQRTDRPEPPLKEPDAAKLAELNERNPQFAKQKPRRDLELEALAEVLEGKRLVHCHSYRQDEMVMLFNVAKDFNFKIGTLQHALEAYKVADIALERTSGGASGFADWWAYKIEVQDAIPGAFPIMHDVGLLVSYNSDSNELARRLNVDAAKAVKYGSISPEEALKFVTLNPAKQLRVDDHMGSLEVGKDADLVVWSGDPLSAFSMAEATYVDGRCLFSLEQDATHRETIRAERQRLIQKLLTEGGAKREGRGEGRGDQARPNDDTRPEGAPRRRRPPNDDAAYSYYLDLFTSGREAAEVPGDCGTGAQP